MESITIIEYQPALFDKINQLWQSLGLGGSYRGDSAEIIEGTLNSGGHLLVMIDHDEEIIGTSWVTNDKRRSYIHHFGISKNYQGRGLGKKLMDRTMEVATLDGYQIKLEVHRENSIAIKLYEKYGFKYLGDYDVLIKR